MGLLRVPCGESYFVEASDCNRLIVRNRDGEEIVKTSLKTIGTRSGGWGTGGWWIRSRMKIFGWVCLSMATR